MKYIEKYLKNIIKVKPLGKLTTEEDEFDGISGEIVYIDGKCSNIFISHIDYANWLEKQVPVDEEKVLIGARKDVALSIMNFIDKNTLGMCLSNMECADLEDAVVNSDWLRLYRHMKKKLEKQGDSLVKNGCTNNKDYIRYAKNYSHEIWHKLMDNFKNIKDYHIGCNEVSDIVLNAIIDTFNWLEKGGDKNKVSKHVEAINEEKVDNANKVEPKDYSSIDPHFGKPADKIEPNFNFNVGQWIVAKMSDQEEIAEIPFGAKDSELQEATYYIPEGFHAEIDDDKVVIKKGEKPTAWSDEDEQITLSIEQVMNCASLLNIVPEKTDKIRTWLKSLKQRIGK